MPSGRTHDRVTLWSLPWVGGGTFLLTRQGELTLIVAAAFLFSGLMFGPDLDIYSVQYKRWGILRWIWLPYQSLLRHRSCLSHGLMVGTVLRLLYLSAVSAMVGIPAIAIAQLIAGFDWNWQQFSQRGIQLVTRDYPREAIALFLGLEIGAMSHSFSDWLGSTYKRHKKSLQKPKTVGRKTREKR
jgi:uncharacterized metal-binding protein